MTYGAETWTLTKHQENKLAVAQRNMERVILNVTRQDRIRNAINRERTKVKDVIERISSMKGQWAGHIARMDNSKWAKITTEWTPREGKRKRGRPKRRWRDGIEEEAGKTWAHIARDRMKWKELWRPSASSDKNGRC